jgi:hypothetical protein
MNAPLKLVIGIATAGRREQLGLMLAQLALQRRVPERIVVCPASTADYDPAGAAALGCPVVVVHGPRGLTAQRNAILAGCTDADVMIFFDDDYYPEAAYLQQVEALFDARPDVVVATNHPVLDGVNGPGLSHDDALRALAQLRPLPAGVGEVLPTYGGYGCNMALRMAPVLDHVLRFDENLPLYGWLEDIDFSRRLARHGRTVECRSLRGVHLGTKRGRDSGLRLGYSQVANPLLYLLRKGSVSAPYAFRQMARNLAKNAVRAAFPEPWVDRRGRVAGNALALRDLVYGRLDPRNVLQLQ